MNSELRNRLCWVNVSVKENIGILTHERRNSVEFDEGLGIFSWVVAVVWITVLIVRYRKGKMGLAMTAGLILLGLGVAGDVPLPTVAPGLANLHSKASWLSLIGLLLILGSWWAARRSKREG